MQNVFDLIEETISSRKSNLFIEFIYNINDIFQETTFSMFCEFLFKKKRKKREMKIIKRNFFKFSFEEKEI